MIVKRKEIEYSMKMIGVKKMVYMEGAEPIGHRSDGIGSLISTGGVGNNGSWLANEKEMKYSMKMIGIKRVVYMEGAEPIGHHSDGVGSLISTGGVGNNGS